MKTFLVLSEMGERPDAGIVCERCEPPLSAVSRTQAFYRGFSLSLLADPGEELTRRYAEQWCASLLPTRHGPVLFPASTLAALQQESP